MFWTADSENAVTRPLIHIGNGTALEFITFDEFKYQPFGFRFPLREQAGFLQVEGQRFSFITERHDSLCRLCNDVGNIIVGIQSPVLDTLVDLRDFRRGGDHGVHNVLTVIIRRFAELSQEIIVIISLGKDSVADSKLTRWRQITLFIEYRVSFCITEYILCGRSSELTVRGVHKLTRAVIDELFQCG